MTHRRLFISTIVACGLLFALATQSLAQYRYTFKDLGTLGGSNSVAYDINNKGEVVGYAYREIQGTVPIMGWDPDNPFEMTIVGYESGTVTRINAFLYDYRQDKMVGLGEPTEYSVASAINEDSLVVGHVGIGSNSTKAFVGGRGFIKNINGPNGMIDASSANDINDEGLIVGNAYSQTSGYFWFKTSYDSLDQVDTYAPLLGRASSCRAVNNQGNIVGDSFVSGSGAYHAILLEGEDVTDLGTLGVGKNSYAEDINDLGQIVGSSNFTYPSGRKHAVLFRPGQSPLDLGTINPDESSEAFGINNLGQIVGRNLWSACLFENGQVLDLNQLTAGVPEGWRLYCATAINDLGQIVGYGCEDSIGSIERAFLLTPIEGVTIDAPLINLMRVQYSMASIVPEPGTMALLLGGGVSLALLTLLRPKRRR